MRIGIYGGSFDPVHLGHMLFAESAREQCRLDRVVFVPTAVSPHKAGQEPTPAADRVDMLKLAIGGYEPFEISFCEAERGGLSYTVDTLKLFSDENPTADLFLLMGADTLEMLPQWKAPEVICRLATLVVAGRPGSTVPDFGCLSELASAKRIARFEANQVHMPLIGLSSSILRQRLADGESIRYQTSRPVEKYIETNRLYKK